MGSSLPLVVTYMDFDEPAAAEEYYAASLADDVPSNESGATGAAVGRCVATEFEGEGPYLSLGSEAGRLYCHRPDGESYRLTWLDTRESVVVSAGGVLDPGQVDDLLTAWASELGPGSGEKDLPDFGGGEPGPLGPEEEEENGEVTAPAPAPGPFPTAREKRLLAAVGKAVRRTCNREPADDLFVGSLAGIQCRGGRGTVYYELQPSLEAMRAAYGGLLAALGRPAGVRRNKGDCVVNPVAESAYTYDERNAGRAFCYRDADSYTIVWTHDQLRILSMLTESPSRQKSLRAFWINSAGPCNAQQHRDGSCG